MNCRKKKMNRKQKQKIHVKNDAYGGKKMISKN